MKKRWRIHQHGGLDVLQLESFDDDGDLASGEIEIKVEWVSLNHLDLWVRKGVEGHRFPLPMTPGCDMVGTVSKTDKSSKFSPGDVVLVDPMMPMSEGFPATSSKFELIGETRDGGCASHFRVTEENLVPLSKDTSPELFAALPIAYVTALSMIERKARAEKDEVILIRGAGSGVSVAALQTAKVLGLQTIVTSRSKEKLDRAAKLGADHLVLQGDEGVRKEIKKITKPLGKRGVDIVIDHVGEATFADSLSCLEWGGRAVTCGATTGANVKVNLNLVFFKNISIHGSTMGSHEDLKKLVSWVESGKLKPVIDQTFDLEDLPKAHQALEAGEIFGKVLLKGFN